MKRLLLASGPDSRGKLAISGKDFHYLIHVRRLRAGDSFPALLPGGEQVSFRVDSVGSGALNGVCVADNDSPASAAGKQACGSAAGQLPAIFLFQAMPKGAKMDAIVRQSTEAGLAEIVPFYTSRSIPRKSGDEKTGRWERIIKEARQQSGSSIATEIREPESLEGALDYWRGLSPKTGRSAILLHEKPIANGTLHGYLNKKAVLVALAVGPEGGFSDAETEQFMGAGFKPIFLGNAVLRVDTAALYGVAAIQTILREKTSWILKTKNLN